MTGSGRPWRAGFAEPSEAELRAIREAPPPADASTDDASPSICVLVVDDNLDAASTLRDLLQMSGCRAEMVHDGLDALEAADRLRPQLILLDIGLPGLNGYQVAGEIRARDWGADVMLVAVTGWGQEGDRRRSHEAGFDRHLVKPVEWSEIEEVLKSAAARSTGGGATVPRG